MKWKSNQYMAPTFPYNLENSLLAYFSYIKLNVLTLIYVLDSNKLFECLYAFICVFAILLS